MSMNILPHPDRLQKKQIRERLQKRLQFRQLSLYEALQQDLAVEWFKQQNPAFLSMLTPEGMKEMINYIIVPGEPDNKMRSFRIPMIATEILSTLMPKVFQLMFTEDKMARGGATLGWLVEYFWKEEPNYVISGYVVKILNNLMVGNAHKVLQYLIKNCCPKMLLFLESSSVAEFLLRLIIVEDLLLNAFIKERLQLFNQLIDTYIENKLPAAVLCNINFMICESFNRLWTLKNKELGRFVNSLFKLIEVVIDYDDKYEQDKILPVIVKLLANFNDHAPFLIMAIYKKIYKKLANLRLGGGTTGFGDKPGSASATLKGKQRVQTRKTIEAFGARNLFLLQSLESIFSQFNVEFVKFVEKENIFPILYGFVKRFEWNNIVLVQIEKIVKCALSKRNDKLYSLVLKNLFDYMHTWRQAIQQTEGSANGRFGHGYKGFLNNLSLELKNSYMQTSSNPSFKQYIDSHSLKKDLEAATQSSDSPNPLRFRVVNQIALPAYKPIAQLCTDYDEFFAEAENINKAYQMQNPAEHFKHKQDDALTNEIQNENQLVYQLLTQAQQGSSSSGDPDGSENNSKKNASSSSADENGNTGNNGRLSSASQSESQELGSSGQSS